MSMSLKFAMPLLSTLAAMVILVHSAEEMDNYNRHEMRARAREARDLDSYEQPWRTVDAMSVSQQTTPIEEWNNSAEDLPRKRRVGRQRKRRPQYLADDDHLSHERYPYREEQPKSYPEYEEFRETTQGVRKRRLPVDWSDEADEHRRLRGSRKRPKQTVLDLDDYNEEKIYDRRKARKPDGEDQIFQQSFSDTLSDDQFIDPDLKINEEHEENDRNANMRPLLEDDIIETTTKEISYTPNGKVEDTSFSSEIYGSMVRPSMTYRLKDLERYTNKNNNDLEGAQNNSTRSITLKDILKRSKGKSLSEILQQQNLSLSDLLQGKINAVSLLKSGKFPKTSNNKNEENHEYIQTHKSDIEEKYIKEENIEPPVTENFAQDFYSKPEEMPINNDIPTTTTSIINVTDEILIKKETPRKIVVNNTNVLARLPKMYARRRFPPGIRRKLRMKPSIGSISKTELGRELVALTGKKYLQRHHRNVTKMSEWKDILPKMMNRSFQHIQSQPEIMKVADFPITEMTFTIKDEEDEVYTTTLTPTEVITNDDNLTQTESEVETTTETFTETESPEAEDTTTVSPTTTSSTTTTTTTTPSPKTRATEKPVSLLMNRTTNNGTALRWQAFNNRMKKKRMRQKNLSETQKHNTDIFEIDNLNPASEFVAKTPPPMTTNANKFTEEFVTSELLNGQESGGRKARLTTLSFRSTTSKVLPTVTTTEKTAKFEIEEILKDTRTSSTLSKILIERNMTLSELFDHRERGSSHVHLADIFHNASKEPSAPEPFLSKSSIEPISKETYPLRAILEANQHDPSVKTTTEPAIMQTRYSNIPLAMDFKNNVNENAENMGIMALFNNFTKIDNLNEEEKSINTDSDASVYKSTVVIADVNDTNRLSRDFKFIEDTARWGDLLSMLKNTVQNETLSNGNDILKEPSSASESFRKQSVEDVDGDGLLILEDFQHLNDKISSILNETLNANTLVQSEGSNVHGILNKPHNTAKSVTVATASIVGLAMVLFLLTYALFKWNQQRIRFNKKQNFTDEHIPTPVFEKRKISRFSNSSRSISPMLSCNIYTMDTLESSNGKESPEYMWDNLRKPFQ